MASQPRPSILDHLRLALLRGTDERLHRQIARQYAQGNYVAKLRSDQAEVRRAIRALQEKITGGR